MTASGPLATASTTIDATADRVWRALTDTDEVREWFFGTEQRSDWEPGSPITWSGDYDGRGLGRQVAQFVWGTAQNYIKGYLGKPGS